MSETVVDIGSEAGQFAENKDIARRLRLDILEPDLDRGNIVVLDFEGSPAATQSFLHALFSHTIRSRGPDILEQIVFRNASETVKSLVSIVAEYSQHGLHEQAEDRSHSVDSDRSGEPRNVKPK